jgi:hypothetical protein
LGASRSITYRPADAGEIRASVFEGQKNNFRDAEATAEAVQRPTMKFVATKSAEQLDLKALHRVRAKNVIVANTEGCFTRNRAAKALYIQGDGVSTSGR